MSENLHSLTGLPVSGFPSLRDVEGVTRDRIYATAEWLNRKFSIIDTGELMT